MYVIEELYSQLSQESLAIFPALVVVSGKRKIDNRGSWIKSPYLFYYFLNGRRITVGLKGQKKWGIIGNRNTLKRQAKIRKDTHRPLCAFYYTIIAIFIGSFCEGESVETASLTSKCFRVLVTANCKSCAFRVSLVVVWVCFCFQLFLIFLSL